jgi:hypothetical protein
VRADAVLSYRQRQARSARISRHDKSMGDVEVAEERLSSRGQAGQKTVAVSSRAKASVRGTAELQRRSRQSMALPEIVAIRVHSDIDMALLDEVRTVVWGVAESQSDVALARAVRRLTGEAHFARGERHLEVEPVARLPKQSACESFEIEQAGDGIQGILRADELHEAEVLANGTSTQAAEDVLSRQ